MCALHTCMCVQFKIGYIYWGITFNIGYRAFPTIDSVDVEINISW